MKRVFIILTALILAIGMLLPATGVLATPVTQTICVQNIGDGVTGGTDHDFCSETPGEEDEWHFVINQVDPTGAAPASITAVFLNAGNVVIPWEKTTGGTAHYRLDGVYLTDTLLSACAELDVNASYGNFNLSHAPCGGGGGDQDIPEVGGEIYPINKVAILSPIIILAMTFLSVTGIILWRRQTQR